MDISRLTREQVIEMTENDRPAIECLAEVVDLLLDERDEYVTNKDELSGRIIQMDTVLKRAAEDMNLLAGECVSSLKCTMCKYNPDDTGCVLDGSQFDDDGECHFEWRG
jgi:hypothetical protein